MNKMRIMKSQMIIILTLDPIIKDKIVWLLMFKNFSKLIFIQSNKYTRLILIPMELVAGKRTPVIVQLTQFNIKVTKITLHNSTGFNQNHWNLTIIFNSRVMASVLGKIILMMEPISLILYDITDLRRVLQK